MKVLAVNAGSSSLKFTAFEMPEEEVLISGYFERIGMDGSFYTLKCQGEKIKKEVELKNHIKAIEYLKEELFNFNIIKDLDEIKAVGHRVVHGGEDYTKTTVITDEVIKKIEELSPLAPLHNPANLTGIKSFMEAIPNALQVAIFDTAFHQTMENDRYLYPFPYEWYEEDKVRKYGFHGTSYQYITEHMQEKLNKKDCNLIVCHIGSGGSICAIKDGKSIDTTMGFGPNAGIMMGTRCGDVDYAGIFYMMRNKGYSLDEMDNILNKKSGLFGISKGFSDSRDIEEEIAKGNKLASLANTMYQNKIVKYIAEYYVELKGDVDAIVLTAGVGENGREFRENVLNDLACLGIKIDKDKNDKIAGYLDINEGIISSDESSVKVYVVPTNEELMMAKEAFRLTK